MTLYFGLGTVRFDILLQPVFQPCGRTTIWKSPCSDLWPVHPVLVCQTARRLEAPNNLLWCPSWEQQAAGGHGGIAWPRVMEIMYGDKTNTSILHMLHVDNISVWHSGEQIKLMVGRNDETKNHVFEHRFFGDGCHVSESMHTHILTNKSPPAIRPTARPILGFLTAGSWQR